jgi:hypothetical protein
MFDTDHIMDRPSEAMSVFGICLGRSILHLVLLRTCSNSSIRVRALNSLKLSRLVVLCGLGSRQDIFLLVNVAEQEVL